MPNARDPESVTLHNILLIGPGGAGKTTQYWTLPTPGFLYVFDPNCIASLTGLNVDYEVFSPDLLDINVHPLSSSKKADSVVKAAEPTAYIRWEEHFENALEENLFDKYKWIGMDSFTTFSDSVMDRVQWINGRLGKQPEQADWASQMFTIQNVMRSMSARKKLFVATAHDELRQEAGGSEKMIYQPVMTGRLRTRMPLLFSNIFRMEAESGRGGTTFVMHLAGDRMHQYVRVSRTIREALRDKDGEVPAELDVTIKDFARADEYGLGSLLRRAGMLEEDPSSHGEGKGSQQPAGTAKGKARRK